MSVDGAVSVAGDVEEQAGAARLVAVVVSVAVLAGWWAAVSPAAGGERGGGGERRYVVVLEESAGRAGEVAKRHADGEGARVARVFSLPSVKGYAARLSRSEAEAIARRPGVAAVGLDPRGAPAGQTMPFFTRRAFAADGDCFPADNPAVNQNLDIDCIDDVRVDVDIAVLDTSIDPSRPDLNVVSNANCFGMDPTAEDGNPDDHTGCQPGPGNLGTECIQAHGELVAGAIAAIDNGIGIVGVAAGARVWSVGVGDKDVAAPSTCDPAYPFYMSDVIAGVEWVTDHADQIEVANMSMQFAVPTNPAGEALATALEEAIDDSIDAGVVYVAAAGNKAEPASDTIPAKYNRVITASAIFDSDGLANGTGLSGPTCEWPLGSTPPTDHDDTNSDRSNYGPYAGTQDPWAAGVDIAAPGTCTSGAAALTSGAAAVLASQDNPDNATDVAAIRHTLLTTANPDDKDNGGYDDKTGTTREPLLDVSDEGEFDPRVIATPESDVDGDGRSDLVALKPDGRVHVRNGTSDYTFGAATASFDGSEDNPLHSAQYIGAGQYAVDIADVDNDSQDDLVTIGSSGTVYVYPGRSDSRFGARVQARTGVDPAVLDPEGHEPIAVADVDGDGYADLITFHHQPRNIMVYRGTAQGSFDPGVVAMADVFSALDSASGEYFMDVADVTGDGLADLVSLMTWNDIWVRAGRSDGTFAAPISSHSGNIDPAMDDGDGYEPVGLGDVTGDRRADVVLENAGTIYVYPALTGSDAGQFGTPATSFAGALTSTTFGAGQFEFVGILDVDGNGRSDLVGIHSVTNALLTGPGQSGGGIASGVVSSGSVKTTQHFGNQNSGSEFVAEKPAYRRSGCATNGCRPWPSSDVVVGFGVASRYGGTGVFWRASDGSIAQRWWNNTAGWSGVGWHGSPPGGATSEPAAVASSSDVEHVFVRGADGSLWHKKWTDATGWSTWTSQGGTLGTGAGPAAVSPATGAVHVFVHAPNGAVSRKRWSGTAGWSAWESVPDTTASNLSAASRYGGTGLFWRDPSGSIMHRWWNSTAGWSVVGWHGNPPGGATSEPAAVASSSDVEHIFVRGTDYALWHKQWTDATGWSAWQSQGGVLSSAPEGVSPSTGTVHVFARGGNGSLWRKRWSEASNWSNWEPVW